MKFKGKAKEPNRVNEHVVGSGGKVIAIFTKGEFETDDKALIGELTRLGYQSDFSNPLPEVAEESESEKPKKKVRK